MSSVDIIVAEARKMCCASCGKSELDDIKLKECGGCDLVNYCSDTCQEDHRSEHDAKCKERVAELRDELLFKQPEGTHDGDCPICCLPLPLDDSKAVVTSCCSILLCKGCANADIARRNFRDRKCPFCRNPLSETEEETNKKRMKRVAANDPIALRRMGVRHFYKEDYDDAFKYWAKAAELGDAEAHYNLSILYSEGLGVEKDEQKDICHLEEAAIAGHPDARFQLGAYEARNGRVNRAVKHWIIAANLGYDRSITVLKDCYRDGDVSKEDFATALRAHHVAVKAMKSPQRDEAARFDAALERLSGHHVLP